MKRKIKQVVTFVLVFMLTFSAFTFANAVSMPDGDVDLDGGVTPADARLVLRYAIGLETFSAKQLAHCDFWHDQNITAATARRVLRMSLGLLLPIDFDNYYNYTDYEIECNLRELPITETEKFQLCNVLGREYGADWVSLAEKAKVIAVIMNRVRSDRYDFRNVNSIDAVLSQPAQFGGNHGGVSMYSYSKTVTKSVKVAVLYYFYVAQYDAAYSNLFYYYGDGWVNHFRSTY